MEFSTIDNLNASKDGLYIQTGVLLIGRPMSRWTYPSLTQAPTVIGIIQTVFTYGLFIGYQILLTPKGKNNNAE